MRNYAQINELNICIGVSSLAGIVKLPNMIEIDECDTDYLWRKYENGIWSAEKFEPTPPPPPPTPEQIRLNQLESENAFIALELVDTQIRLDQTEQTQADLLLLLVEKGVV